MSNALVLMKAMPPTKGHERLLNFAMGFSHEGVVIMDTAPDEPFVSERIEWLRNQTALSSWNVRHLMLDDQDPKSDGFWERWKGYIDDAGTFDCVIGSEVYCAKVAEVIGARYIPYDPDRLLVDTRATNVRKDPLRRFSDIAFDFQHNIRTTVTIFGAESTGKTTLSRRLANALDGEWVFEWARPYLENTGQTVVDRKAMEEIWHGQFAAEQNAEMLTDKPFIIRDTDLYSTIGYWEQPHWVEELGPVPDGLIYNASYHKADLYIITPSNIPFEKDPLRYGGDHRESPDEYWISVAEKYELPYLVLPGRDRSARLLNATYRARAKFDEKIDKLDYSRELVKA